VDFASAASPIAVCSYCRSTLAREGEALRRIGQSAELFDDHSPLQLGAAGRWQGAAFTLIGRLQLRYAQGSWNEWHVLFDSGKGGWLSEDNGRHVMAFDAPAPAEPAGLPRLGALQVGAGVQFAGAAWDVAGVTPARIAAAQGELPYAPELAREFTLVDLRNRAGEVGTLDYTNTEQPRWSIGRGVALADLALTGLRQAVSEKTLGARATECPSCGSALEVKLSTTRSIVCRQCKAVVDVSQGVGADLAFYAQDNPDVDGAQPLLPLGASATLALGGTAQTWQVVGYVERCETSDAAADDDEQAFWREYLLYSRAVGFTFLIDAEDGWSWSTPLTGAPQLRGERANWQGRDHHKLYSYGGRIVYVLGEFYWKLERGQRTWNTDFAAGTERLNREQTRGEVTWSAGQTLKAEVIAAAFHLPPERQVALRRDAAAFSGGGASGWLTRRWLWIVWGLIMLVVLVHACSRDRCDDLRDTWGDTSPEYQQCLRSKNHSGSSGSGGGGGSGRTGGSSWGGYGSGGGGHK
jgi:hypothetical protein